MKVYQKVLQEVDELEKCFCNRCGKEIRSAIGIFNDESDYQHFRFTWGYVSKLDGQTWEFDLCDSCLVELNSQFKIPAKIEQYY